MKKSVFCMSVLLTVSSHANAGWSESGTVARHYVNSNGGSYVSLTAPKHNPAGCANTNWYRYEKPTATGDGNSAYNEISATLLAAKVSGRSVQVFIDDTTCSGGYAKLRHVIME